MIRAGSPKRRSRGRPWRVTAGLVSMGAVLGACGGDRSPPAVLAGWEQHEVHWSVNDQLYDRVAVSSGPRPAWMTWAPNRVEDTLEVLFWDVGNRFDTVERSLLETPTELGLVYPRGLHVAGHRWVAVANTRPEPGRHTEHVIAWQGLTGSTGNRNLVPATQLELPDGVAPDRSDPVAAQLGEVALVMQLTVPAHEEGARGYPAVPDGFVAWISTDDDTWTRIDEPALASAAQLTRIRLTADHEQFVLTGVDADDGVHLWRSVDGLKWSPVGDGVLPTAGSVRGITTAGRGHVIVALGSSGAVALYEIRGDEVVAAGELTGHDASPAVALEGAAFVGDELVLVGAQADDSSLRDRPVLWARAGDEWVVIEDRAFSGHGGLTARAVAGDDDGDGAALLLVGTYRNDVQRWRWQPPD